MRKAWLTALTVAVVLSMAGCSKQTRINSYVLPGGNVGGDSAKGIAPIQNVVVWPLINVAAGGKAKGVELVLTDYLVDTLYLKDTFKSVYILDEAEAKNLLARAGEELGLKKKPKSPTQGGLTVTKIGLLTGSEAILLGRIDDYDEVKVEKSTYTGVSLSFFLYDAREQSYPTLDSFTPARALWRTNAFRSSKETPFQARISLYATSRKLIEQVADRLERDLSRGSAAIEKRRKKKIDDLRKQARDQRGDGKYDEALATLNEILKLDPENGEAKAAIDLVNTEKAAAAEKEKQEQLKNEIALLKKAAQEMEEAGDTAGALEEWSKVLELDETDKEAGAKAAALRETLQAEQTVQAEQDKGKNLHLAQKALGEMKYSEAIAAAKKVLAVEPGNEKAQQVLAAAEEKLAEAKAVEEEAAPAPVEPAAEKAEEPAPAAEKAEEPAPAAEKAEEPAPAAEKAEEPAPAAVGDGDVETLRNQAMEYFNNEEYEKAEGAWKQLLGIAPDDKQAQEMLETTQMLIEALK
jgi:tetratricopeptide (TPR) repeat protein